MPALPGKSIRPLWARPLQAGAQGLSLAREAGLLLAWDRAHWLSLLDRHGHVQAQRHFPAGVASACCADDGSAGAVTGAQGEVSWLAPDLTPRWVKQIGAPGLACATDPFGQYLAVADTQGNVHFFDNTGRLTCRAQSPRALRHLAFVPGVPVLLGAADYGLLAAFDLAGRLLWRVALVVYIGGLAVSGTGDSILLSCFTEGLHRYGLRGEDRGRVTPAEPCQTAALSFDGGLTLAATTGNRLLLLDAGGRQLGGHALEKPAAAMALGALGRDAAVALADGPVLRLAVEDQRR